MNSFLGSNKLELRFLFPILGIIIVYVLGCDSKNREQQKSHLKKTYRTFSSIETDQIIPNLSHTVQESSGMILVDRQLWTINDSGNYPELYQLDTLTGDIIRVVPILDAKNFDWEALTFDKRFIYIGDTGNNKGLRINLSVYRILRKTLLNKSIIKVPAEKISFQYDNQNMLALFAKHDFDCEAIFAANDSLFLITKNRSNFKANIYSIPNQPGFWKASQIGSFDSHGQITEVSINEKTCNMALLGYVYYPHLKKNISFVWRFDKFSYPHFWKHEGERWNLDLNRQTEAITWTDSNTCWISSERSNFPAASVYKVVLPSVN